MEDNERVEFYNFMKGLAPDDVNEKEKLGEVINELEKKRSHIKHYEKSCQDLADKVDGKTAQIIRENAEKWLDSLKGDHELYGFALGKLGELAVASPKVAQTTAKKFNRILGNLASRYEVCGDPAMNRLYCSTHKFTETLGLVMDGILELAGTDRKSAEALLDHAWGWPKMTESQNFSHYISGEVQHSDYRRLMNIIKEAARNGNGKELIEVTRELLKEHDGNLLNYFNDTKEKYDITGEFLDGPLDFLQYEPEYLNYLVDSHMRHHFGIKEQSWDSIAGEMKRLVAFREAYKPAEGTSVTSPTKQEEKLKNLIEYAEDLTSEMRSYRDHMAGPGDLKIIEGRLQILEGMADNYGHSYTS